MQSTGTIIGDGPLLGAFNKNTKSHESSEALLKSLLLVNVLVWFFTSIFSYFLARKTLRPIKEMYELQEKFVADVAHELRTPLAVMKSGSEITLKSDRSIAEYKSFIKDSLEEIDRLIALSSDLLVLLQSRFLGNREKESINFSELIQTGVTQIKAYAGEKNVSFKVDIQENVFVMGISSDLTRLSVNLFKNAVDHNVVGGEVRVTLKQDDTFAKLSVSDTGVGINEEDIKNIFNRFFKADTARTQKAGVGSGLGLSLVQEIVNTHDGSIEVVSELGKGATFTVQIPCV